jgi:hypothetical protein
VGLERLQSTNKKVKNLKERLEIIRENTSFEKKIEVLLKVCHQNILCSTDIFPFKKGEYLIDSF